MAFGPRGEPFALLTMTWVNTTADIVAQEQLSSREKEEVLRYVARKAKARFYADENFPAKAAAVLREWGARVRTVQAAGQRGHPDENHAAYALKNGLILLTCDRDFLDNRRFPLVYCPAIFVFDFGGGSVREIKQAFGCLWGPFVVPQFFDKWCKVDAGRESWVESVRYLNGQTSRTRYRLWRGQLQEWVDG
jgi:predicted nuclease of predicted toxin-antitoxin system